MTTDRISEMPLITVFMPTHNRKDLLNRAINSVLSQTYTNIELVIVDDGSSDETWEYLLNLKDPRIRIFRNEIPVGACAARNRAIFEARGDLITGIDDDDYFREDRIMDLWRGYDRQYSFVFSRKNSLKLLAVAPIVFLFRTVSLRQLLNYNIVGGFCLIETKRIKKVGGFDENLSALQDYDLWVRLVLAYGSPRLIFSDSYAVDRQHGGTRITNADNRIKAYADFLRKYRMIMTRGNLNSLYLREAEWSESKVSFSMLLRAFFDGNIRWVLRRFLKGR